MLMKTAQSGKLDRSYVVLAQMIKAWLLRNAGSRGSKIAIAYWVL